MSSIGIPWLSYVRAIANMTVGESNRMHVKVAEWNLNHTFKYHLESVIVSLPASCQRP